MGIVLDNMGELLESYARILWHLPTQRPKLNCHFELLILFPRNKNRPAARCLKITEKVSFNIASEASYVYNLIKNAPKLSILASFWTPKACGQTVLPDRSVLIGQKLAENAKIKISKFDILSHFQTMCPNCYHSCFYQPFFQYLIFRAKTSQHWTCRFFVRTRMIRLPV